MILGGGIIKNFIQKIRMIFVILAFILFIFNILIWVSDEVFELLRPTALSSIDDRFEITLVSSGGVIFLLYIYWVLGVGDIRESNISENKIIKIIARVVFSCNIVLIIYFIYIQFVYEAGMWSLF